MRRRAAKVLIRNDVKCQRTMRSVNGDPTSEGNKPRVRCADEGEVTRKVQESDWWTENEIKIRVIKQILENKIWEKLHFKHCYKKEETLDSLFKDVLRVHPSEVLGQFDGENDAGQQKDTAASQTEPERVLKHNVRQKGLSLFSLYLI